MKRWGWLVALIASLCIWGCGDSGFEQQISGAPANSPPIRTQLSGVWGGYFPGSSFQHPEAGLELHFERPIRDGVLHRAGFIHREERQAHRHDVEVQQFGDQVVLTFDPGSADEGLFEGVFVDDNTLRGTYTNEARGESYTMDLVDADSVEVEIKPILSQAVAPAPRAQGAGSDYLTLQLKFNHTFGQYPVLATTMSFGLGPYRDFSFADSRWKADRAFTNESCLSDECSAVAQEGHSTVSTMTFYPNWLLLEIYSDPEDPGQDDNFTALLASIELPWECLITLDGSRMASGSWAHQFFDDDGDEISRSGVLSDLQMSWQPTAERFDMSGFAVRADNADYRDVFVDFDNFNVPANARDMLESLGFTLTYLN